MNYRDPSRAHHLNGRPCWSQSAIAIPRFEIEPHDQSHLLYLRACHGQRGVWLETTINKLDLLPILADWEASPEATFQRLFGVEPPRGLPSPKLSGAPRPHNTFDQPAEDLI